MSHQFPVGLVAAALSFAVLPTLTEHARNGDIQRFKQTLLLGFRVGLLLMIPAIGYFLAALIGSLMAAKVANSTLYSSPPCFSTLRI